MRRSAAPRQTVRRGYNRISFHYRTDRGWGPDAKKMSPWLREIDRRITEHGRILELGCGMGVPAAEFFSRRHDYLGIDLSEIQIQRAEKLVPAGKFRRMDMSRLRFPASSFDAVLSYYAIIHLPRGEQKPLFKRIFKWLKPGGLFQAVLGWDRWTGRSKDFFGAEMFWSHADQETYCRWLEEAGLRILSRRLIREGKGGHVLFLCQKKPG